MNATFHTKNLNVLVENISLLPDYAGMHQKEG